MKLKLTLLAIVTVLSSCTAPTPGWSQFNPLDKPGEPPATVEDLHEQNIRIITSNPGYSFAP